MKINIHQFNEHLGQLANHDMGIRQKGVSDLSKYSSAEWLGTPEAVSSAVPALVKASRLGGAAPSDGTIRADAAKALGNIGAESPAVVPELLRILQDDSDSKARTEAAHALGKIGEKAESASRALAAVGGDPSSGDILRGQAPTPLPPLS